MDHTYGNNTPVIDIISMLDRLRGSIAPGQLSHSQIQELVKNLPKLSEAELNELGHKDSLCSICFTPFLAVLAEEEMAEAMDSPAHPVEHLGVTRLAQAWQCGHLFCRRDISKWIQDGHDSCPMCRRPLIEGGASQSTPISESETTELENLLASLAGGEIPNIDHFRHLESHPSNQEDRREFSGMYS